MYGYIYKTTLPDGRIYIGQHIATTFDSKYFGSGTEFLKIIREIGKQGLKCELIDTADSLPELNQKEIYWIEKLNARDNLIGVNRSKGGRSKEFFADQHHSDEAKGKISLSSKDRVQINNGVVNKSIKKDFLDDYTSEGWTLGWIKDKGYRKSRDRNSKISMKKKGKISYTDGYVVKRLSIDDYMSTYKEKGYRPGFRNNAGKIIFSDIHVTNGKIIKTVTSTKAEQYISKHWSYYPCDLEEAKKCYAEHISSVRKAVQTNYYKNQTEEQRESKAHKIRVARKYQINVKLDSNKGKCRIYFPASNEYKYILPEELDIYLQNGWLKGQSDISKKKMKENKKPHQVSAETRRKSSIAHLGQQVDNKWMNNGVTNKRIHKDLVAEYQKEGWILGRIKNA